MKKKGLWDRWRAACGVQLAAELLHEINNFLTRILVSLPASASSHPDADNWSAEWESIPHEIMRIRRSIDCLLQLFQVPISRSPRIEINRLLDILLSSLESQPRFALISLKRSLSHPGPTLEGDVTEWWALLLSLIMLATQSLPRGGMVEVRTSSENGDSFGLSIQTFSGSDSASASAPSPLATISLFGPGSEVQILRFAQETARRARGSVTSVAGRMGGLSQVSFILPMASP